MNYDKYRNIGVELAEVLRKYFDEQQDDKKISSKQQILKLKDLKKILREFEVLNLKCELEIQGYFYSPYIKVDGSKSIIYCPENLKDGVMAISIMNGLGKILLNSDDISVCDGWKIDEPNTKESKEDRLIAEGFSRGFVIPKDLFYYYLNMYSTLDDTCHVDKMMDEFQVDANHIVERGKMLGVFKL